MALNRRSPVAPASKAAGSLPTGNRASCSSATERLARDTSSASASTREEYLDVYFYSSTA